MSKVTYKSNILQYAPANSLGSDQELESQASVTQFSSRLKNRPRIISYYPKLATLLGDVYATIFLQQVYHRYMNNGDKPFYKFFTPCSSEYYRKGDSWIEELSFTYSQLKRAIGTVSTKTSSTRKQPGSSKNLLLSIAQVELSATGKVLNAEALVLYWTDRDHRTWWMVNRPLFISLLQIAGFPNPQNADQLIDESPISLIGSPAIGFPHAKTSNIDKNIAAPQRQIFPLEKQLLETQPASVQKDISLNQYVRGIDEACYVNRGLCSTEMAEEILSAARSFQVAGRSVEQIALVGHWWKNHYWKGQKGTPPRPNDLLDMYGAAENFYTSGDASDCCRVFIEQWRSANGLEAERG